MSGWHWGLGRLHQGPGPSRLRGCFGSHSTAPWWRSSQRPEQTPAGEWALGSSAQRPRCPSGPPSWYSPWWRRPPEQPDQSGRASRRTARWVYRDSSGWRQKEANENWAPWIFNPKSLKLCLEETWDLRKSAWDFVGHKVPATCLKRAVSSPLPQQSSWKMEKKRGRLKAVQEKKKRSDCRDGSTS